jgi:hypothetical protein
MASMRGGGGLRRSLAGLFALALAAGCSHEVRPEVLQGWVGKPADALRQDWGPATREIQDGETRILVYEQFERNTSDDFTTNRPNARNTYGRAQEQAEALRSPTVYARAYVFWVNREGIIVQSGVRRP